ncbi:hypothetical protein CKALI_01200 [Corynebacterium kalinowskii]|uniref:DUF2613 domain-containing protein n=1 Tax=Corynebacterium kalinowskii TaxID=2675216 RepID=A0A6B8VV22_9CORY|nr:DUF2613 domain-containing protein [Corynebacterium kalinowskii]QGU01140.1 hypothetical protein CKALI_01200 [Corynebacterium kalinowskii]
MALETDSLTRRSIGPALASAVVGLVVGVAAVIGVATVSNQDSLPAGPVANADTALLGGPEYGSRQ